MALIKDIRAVEWTEGRRIKQFKWDIQVMLEGSRKWEPIRLVKLARKPTKTSKEK
jgi:hypothetical protein